MRSAPCPRKQYVCTVCGFNLVGFHPAHCPFAGPPREKFPHLGGVLGPLPGGGQPGDRPGHPASMQRRPSVSNTPPTAWRPGKTYWIELPRRPLTRSQARRRHHVHPSPFSGGLESVPGTLGAKVRIQEGDSDHELCRRFHLRYQIFGPDFSEDGIEACHLGGPYPRIYHVFFSAIACLSAITCCLGRAGWSSTPSGRRGRPLPAASASERSWSNAPPRRPGLRGQLRDAVCALVGEFQKMPTYGGY